MFSGQSYPVWVTDAHGLGVHMEKRLLQQAPQYCPKTLFFHFFVAKIIPATFSVFEDAPATYSVLEDAPGSDFFILLATLPEFIY